MIELRHDVLEFRFPEVHRDAVLRVQFQRTLRIPDDGRDHFLPPGLGGFPLRHVDDFAQRVPGEWRTRGGVMLPMYQSEAMWISFGSTAGYPFAVKVAAGKVNAATGDAWSPGLQADPQDYLAIPTQPWLDGYAVERGVVRQFVAMPLGAGFTAEEQLTGKAEHGGVQISARPLRREKWEEILRERERAYQRMPVMADAMCMPCAAPAAAGAAMGLAPGGRMRQEIHDDPFRLDDYDAEVGSRCFVHIANSMVWRSITGQDPPTTPPTAAEYTRAGLPWFDFYSERPAASGGGLLSRLKGIVQLGTERGHVPLPENESVDPAHVVKIHGS